MRRLWTVRLLKDRPFIFGKKIICLLSPLILAVMGFSAGGILCGDLLLNFDGLVNGTTLDPSYVPDELDNVLADACAVGIQDTPHGFGYQGNWIPDYVEWLDGIMKNN